jgi:hypothetical protein
MCCAGSAADSPEVDSAAASAAAALPTESAATATPAAAVVPPKQSLEEPALFLRAVAANIQAGKKVTRASAQSILGEWHCRLLLFCNLCLDVCGE